MITIIVFILFLIKDKTPKPMQFERFLLFINISLVIDIIGVVYFNCI